MPEIEGYDDNEVVLEIGDEVPQEHRDAIKASVAAMARRSAEASKRAVERGRAQNELLTALARPPGKLLEADPESAEAVAVATRRFDELRVAPPTMASPSPTVRVVKPSSAGPLFAASNFLADTVSRHALSLQLELEARRGPGDRGCEQGRRQTLYPDSRRLRGSQCVRRARRHRRLAEQQHVQSVVGRSLRRTDWLYSVGAGNLGGNATAEGGTEMTVMQAGGLVDSAIDRRFRLRCTNGEDGSDETGGLETGDGDVQVDWIMHPGLSFQFNVGAYAFCDAYRGLAPFSGKSTSFVRIEARVILLTADFTE